VGDDAALMVVWQRDKRWGVWCGHLSMKKWRVHCAPAIFFEATTCLLMIYRLYRLYRFFGFNQYHAA
jgi:hypothetical protein